MTLCNLLPAQLASPMTAFFALATALLVLALRSHMSRGGSRWSTVGLGTLFVAAVATVWMIIVNHVGEAWSVTRLSDSTDLIGTGTSVQRTVGAAAWSGSLLPEVWSHTLVGCLVAAGAVWLTITMKSRRSHATVHVMRRR